MLFLLLMAIRALYDVDSKPRTYYQLSTYHEHDFPFLKLFLQMRMILLVHKSKIKNEDRKEMQLVSNASSKFSILKLYQTIAGIFFSRLRFQLD